MLNTVDGQGFSDIHSIGFGLVSFWTELPQFLLRQKYRPLQTL
jgi:hypothetical protein